MHVIVFLRWQMGAKELGIASVRQMCGRAGRMLLDTKGEAILMVGNTSQQRALGLRLCTAPMEPLLVGDAMHTPMNTFELSVRYSFFT